MKSQNARGTRDFSPSEIKKRNYIINIIREQFELYGFLPIETPAIENLSTLTGKYGEEGDQLLFKILNSRLHESKNKTLLKQEFEKMLEAPYNSELITERALRYDLTVPFARYVSQYRHQITFPFKRYQIQPVWRADKPQKGRYREFIQCDADAIGTSSLLMEIEFIQLINNVFTKLQLPVTLKINHRKIITGILEEHIPEQKYHTSIITIIDKLDKISQEQVSQELSQTGLSAQQIDKLFELLNISGDNFQKLEKLKKISNSLLQQGINEIYYILNFHKQNLLNIQLELDIKLARGLNYYTGTIFEGKCNIGNLSSSILGGGRYDDLTGIFDLPNVSGVGISFGIDRIYDIIDEVNLFPNDLNTIYPAKLLLIYFDEASLKYSLNIAEQLRKAGISTEIYHQIDKIKKAMEYANKKSFPYVGLIGEDEMNNNTISLKDMHSGNQEKLSVQQLIEKLNVL